MRRTVANERTASALLGALILTSTLVGCASENRLFSKDDDGTGAWRRGRGEYSVVDESTAQDWEAATKTRSGLSASDSVSGFDAESDLSSVRGERVAVHKPVDVETRVERGQSRPSADDLPELPPPPKRFSERMKDFFSWSKTDGESNADEFGSSADFSDVSTGETASRRNATGKTLGRSASEASMETPSGQSFDRASRAADSAPIASSSVKNRSGSASGKYGEIRKPVGQSWTDGWNNLTGGLTKTRRVASLPIDPVLQYDESRFLPSSETVQKYYSPLESIESSGFASSGDETSLEAFSSSQAFAKPPISGKSGRELVYELQTDLSAQAFATSNAESESFARSGSVPTAPVENANVLKSASNDVREMGKKTANNGILNGESAFGWNDDAARLAFAIPIVARSNVRPSVLVSNGGNLEEKGVKNAISQVPGSSCAKANFTDFSIGASETEVASESVAAAPAVSSDLIAESAGLTETIEADGMTESVETNGVIDAPATDSRQETAANDFALLLGEKSFGWFESAPSTAVANLSASTISSDATSASDSTFAENVPAHLTYDRTAAIPETVATDFESASAIPSEGDAPVSNGLLSVSATFSNGVVTSNEGAPSVFENVPSSVDERKTANDAKPPTDEEIAWIEQIKSAIRALLQKRDAKKARGDDVRGDDARLRLLYLAVGEYERSIQEIQDENDPLKAFWEKECRGLETLLQNRVEEIDPALVAERLRSGLDSLSGLCDLQIRKAVLAVAPACFGLFEERKTPYLPGETLYAYSELDFVSSVETENGFEIEVECRWRLVDSNGNARTPYETQRCSNISETKLRDVVLNVAVPLPNELEPGVYALEMEVVDRQSENSTPAIRRILLNVVEKDD